MDIVLLMELTALQHLPRLYHFRYASVMIGMAVVGIVLWAWIAVPAVGLIPGPGGDNHIACIALLALLM